MSALHNWIQFSWDFTQLPSSAPAFDRRFALQVAVPDDARDLDACLSRSYSTEHGWTLEMKRRLTAIRILVDRDLPEGTMDFLVVRHGVRIIAACALHSREDAQSHLPTGVCVQSEYRCRGIGTYLLYESLRQLQERGLSTARVITRKGITAERFLYPKFGGVATPMEDDVVR
ncbi:MAG: GNAT family N-acetyltransferase [Candidatus Methylacidiphilales bacterium]|nr:GNAT family N-acetyltransferase [Candidatus Methylacidiphilales bacterium]